MSRRKLYLENDKLFCIDSNGKVKKLNCAYKVYRVVNDIITNGYDIVFSGNNMILRSGKKELELVDYLNLLDHKLLGFLDYDILKNMAINNQSKVKEKNRKRLYSKDNKLFFDYCGIVRELDKISKVHTSLDDVISEGYNIVFEDNNMVLVGKSSQLELVDYINLLDNKYLGFLDYDIRKNMLINGVSGVDNKNRKSYYKYAFRSVACISILVSILFNTIPGNVFGTSKNKPSTKNSSISTNEVSDDLGAFDSAMKNGDFSSRDVEGIYDFYKKPTFLADSFNNGIKIIRNADNSILDENDENDKTEEIFSDEDIEKICEFMNYNHLTLESFASLIGLMTSEECPFGVLYPSSEVAIKAITQEELSYEVKFLTIMIREGNTYAEIDKMCAGVCGEATGDGNCYEDAYAVASTLVNRTHKDSYVNKYGQRLYDQFCAPGQYEVDISGNYKRFLGQIDLEGYHAAIDAFYTRESMHSYIEFRANWVDLNNYEMFVPGGNKFIAKMKDSQYVPYPEEEIDLDDVKVLVLENTNY